jgi:hypothetical protein
LLLLRPPLPLLEELAPLEMLQPTPLLPPLLAGIVLVVVVEVQLLPLLLP